MVMVVLIMIDDDVIEAVMSKTERKNHRSPIEPLPKTTTIHTIATTSLATEVTANNRGNRNAQLKLGTRL